MITQETIQKVKDTMRIEDVVGGYMSLRRRGANLIGLCPFHEERTPSFNVSPVRNYCHCFGCGEGGDPIAFVRKIDNCSFSEAIRKIAEIYHIPVEETAMTAEEQEKQDDRESMLAVNKWANGWFQNQLWNTQEGQAVGLSYFHQRGLRDDIIREFGLGYSPEKGSPLSREAVKLGYAEKYLVNVPDARDMKKSLGTGLCCKSDRDKRLFDRFSARVMFPFFSVSGQVVGFAGRIMTDRKDVGKYVNSPESMVYLKRNELFGIYQAKKTISKEKMAYLVEGQMDVISMHQAGVKNAICSGGTALTEGHVHKIHMLTDAVTVLYDGDSAGIHATLKAINMFLEEKMRVKVMLFPDGDDPDSFSRKHTAEEFRDYIRDNAVDFVQYMVQVLLNGVGDDTSKRFEAINTIIETLAIIGDAVERQLYVKELAEILGMKEDTVTKSVNAARTKYIKTKKMERERQEAQEARAEEAAAQDAVMEELASGVPQKPVAAPTSTLDAKIAQNYYNIAQMIVRHGNEIYQDNGDGTFVPIGLVLVQNLQAENMHSDNPLLEKVFAEYTAHFADEGFTPEGYFSQHCDMDMASLAAKMLMEQQVQNTKGRRDDNYAKQAYHLLCELKFNICDKRLKTDKNLTPELQKALLAARAAFDKERRK